MHSVFVSEGLIVRKRGVGEANILVDIFTKEFGLLRAAARSARKEVSKLRFGLEPYTSAQYSLVKGHYEWKLIGVDHITRELLTSIPERRSQIARVVQLLLRLIQGEEPIPKTYDDIVSGFQLLGRTQGKEDAQILECLLVLRVLHALGYIPENEKLQPFLQSVSLESILPEARVSKALLIRTINASLQATGL